MIQLTLVVANLLSFVYSQQMLIDITAYMNNSKSQKKKLFEHLIQSAPT